MALPNMVGVQQAGVDPQSVQKQNDNNQAVANALREVQARLDNIMNVRGNVQAGVFGSFGNNFLSRGIVGIVDAITDSIDSVFGQGEDEREDPVSKAIKEQTAILREVSAATSHVEKTSEIIVDEITLLRRDINHNQELQHADTLDQDKILENILDALSGTGRSYSEDAGLDSAAFSHIIDSLQGINANKTDGKAFEKVVDDIRAASSKTTSEVTDVDSRDIEQQTPTHNKKQSTILDKIFSTLTSINKNLDKLVRAQPMSTREAELDAIRVKREDLAKRTAVEDIKTVDEGGKRGFDWSRILSGMLDFEANLRGMKNVFSIVVGAMRSGIGLLTAAISPIVGMLTKFGTVLGSVISSVASAGTSIAGTIASVGAGVVKKAMPYAIPAAVMGAAGAGVDYLSGKFGVGGETIDVEQDDKNWAKMGFFEKFESGAARGIEKIAGVLSLDNFANEARASRITSETEYLKRKSAGDGLAQIEVTQSDLKKLEMQMLNKSSPSGAGSVIQDNRVTQNQTIMPTRTVVENPESSYRRYMNNILQPGR